MPHICLSSVKIWIFLIVFKALSRFSDAIQQIPQHQEEWDPLLNVACCLQIISCGRFRAGQAGALYWWKLFILFYSWTITVAWVDSHNMHNILQILIVCWEPENYTDLKIRCKLAMLNWMGHCFAIQNFCVYCQMRVCERHCRSAGWSVSPSKFNTIWRPQFLP